jgi:hypothetical protein
LLPALRRLRANDSLSAFRFTEMRVSASGRHRLVYLRLQALRVKSAGSFGIELRATVRLIPLRSPMRKGRHQRIPSRIIMPRITIVIEALDPAQYAGLLIG